MNIYKNFLSKKKKKGIFIRILSGSYAGCFNIVINTLFIFFGLLASRFETIKRDKII